MPPQTRVRSRSSVEHIFDLVEGLDEDQLHNLLDELNSTTDTNVPVSKGVEYFEEQRRARAQQKVLRPTPSFLNSPHEPVDWPRQKPRPVSGSQWRQSMRVVSMPYGQLGRHQTEPISPPLTASPPSSPPLSPPSHESPLSPRRTVTTPILLMEKSARHAGEIESLPLQKRPASPPRQHDDEEHDDSARERESRPSLHEFGGFSFGLDGTASTAPKTPQQQQQPSKEARPVSPLSSQQQEQDAPTPAPQRADFSRISTMPLPSLAATDSLFDLPRPRTSTGDAATTANTFKPRAFRRISRPQFLSPANIPTPDALAERLSQYFFDGPSSPPPTTGFSSFAAPPPSRPSAEMSMEQMLKEPAAPPSKLVLGRVEKEVPNVGIFEVLTEG